jgi:hypothetical protein
MVSASCAALVCLSIVRMLTERQDRAARRHLLEV